MNKRDANASGSIRDFIFCRGKAWLIGEQLFPLTADDKEGKNDGPMNVKFAVLADYALLDQGGKLSILGIFDQVRPPMLPFNMPQMYWVIVVEGEASEAGRQFPMELLIWDADGNQLFANEVTFAFPPAQQPGSKVAHNSIIALAGIPFVNAGDHSFIVRINGEERNRIRLQVSRVALPPEQPT